MISKARHRQASLLFLLIVLQSPLLGFAQNFLSAGSAPYGLSAVNGAAGDPCHSAQNAPSEGVEPSSQAAIVEGNNCCDELCSCEQGGCHVQFGLVQLAEYEFSATSNSYLVSNSYYTSPQLSFPAFPPII